MIRVLIALDDCVLSDIVVTAFKQFNQIATYRIPTNRTCEMIAGGTYDAVVVALNKGDESRTGSVHRIREVSRNIEILGLVDRDIKDRFNRFKLEHSIFSLVGMPLDAFALARSIARLESTMAKKTAAARD